MVEEKRNNRFRLSIVKEQCANPFFTIDALSSILEKWREQDLLIRDYTFDEIDADWSTDSRVTVVVTLKLFERPETALMAVDKILSAGAFNSTCEQKAYLHQSGCRFEFGKQRRHVFAVTDGESTIVSSRDLHHMQLPPFDTYTGLVDKEARSPGALKETLSKSGDPVFRSSRAFRHVCQTNNLEQHATRSTASKMTWAWLTLILCMSMSAYATDYFGIDGSLLAWLFVIALLPPLSVALWGESEADARMLFRSGTKYSLQWRLFRKILEAAEQTAFERNWIEYQALLNHRTLPALTGDQFEVTVATLFERSGYKVSFTPSAGDFGIDLLATNSQETLAIQVKHLKDRTGIKAVQEAFSGARFYNADQAVVVASGIYTYSAKTLAARLDVRLIDGKCLKKQWYEAQLPEIAPPFDMAEYLRRREEIESSIKISKRR